MRNGMTCPKERGGCGKPLAWDDGAFCKDCMVKATYAKMAADTNRALDDRLANGLCEDPYDDDPGEYPGGYSDYGSHQQSFNRRGGCSS